MEMDLDVDNYSIEDLTQLLDINVLTRRAILQATDEQLQKHEKNKDLVLFFTQARERLLESLDEEAVATTFQSDVKRGNINPDLKNTVTRFINIDSSCRTFIDNQNLSSDSFDFELTESLLNVVSMALYSVEIPQSWFNNSTSKGTNSVVVCITSVGNGTIESSTIRHTVLIREGNYSTAGLPAAVATAIQSATGLVTTVTLDPNTGIAEFQITAENVTDIIQLIWFDVAFSTKELLNSRYNANLGWMLGFRSPVTTCDIVTNGSGDNTVERRAVPVSPVDANGTKYIIMSLNDYKTNRINRSLLSVNTFPIIPIQTPSYFNASIPQVRVSPTQVNAIESNPRQLTEKQLYTINAIAEQQTLNRRFITHVGSDTFAKIPLKKTDWNKYENGTSVLIDNGPSRLFVDAGGPLQLQMREYFGPVDITQMSISLYDDKGHSLELNGLDWSCTLMVKCIYQY
jgi:hypothetical protein